MTDNPTVSIIIPVYQTAAYLDQCLQSVLNQSYPQIEVILVDDGSPDQCPQMCDRYAVSHSSVRVIHKQNEGCALARQAGLAAACGAYVMFLDSDDWLEPDTIAQCLTRAQAAAADCVMFSYVREYPNKSIPAFIFDHDFDCNPEESELIVHRRLIGSIGSELTKPHRIDNLSPVWGKLYRTTAARHGKFISERCVGTSEDTVFNLYALEGCRISYIHRCMYHYRKHNPHAITAQYKPDLAEKWDIVYQVFQSYIAQSKHPEHCFPAFFNRVACGMIGLGLNEAKNPAGLKCKALNLGSILSEPLYQEAFFRLDTSPCPIHWRLFFWLCRHKMTMSLAILLNLMNFLRSRANA